MPVLASRNPDHQVEKQTAESIPADGTGEPHDGADDWKTAYVEPGVISLDPWLSPYKEALRSRFAKAQAWIKNIEESEGGLEKFSRV
jgi:hypothetical protein